MSEPGKVGGWGEWLLSGALLFGSLAAFLEAVYLLWVDRVAAATVAGGLFLVLFLLRSFPELESFKGLGIEVKRLKETVRQAQVDLEKFRNLSLLSAKQTYLQMAWMNRLGTASREQKSAIVSSFDKLLSELGVGETERRAAKEPYVSMILADLYSAYLKTVSGRVEYQIGILNRELGQVFGRDPVDMRSEKYEIYKALEDRLININNWKRSHRHSVSDRISNNGREVFDSVLDGVDLDEGDISKLRGLAKEALSVAAEVQRRGDATPESEEFTSGARTGVNQHYKRLFGQDAVG